MNLFNCTFREGSVAWEIDMGLAEDLETQVVDQSIEAFRIGIFKDGARRRRRYGVFGCREDEIWMKFCEVPRDNA
jgi:hypothetical protein